MVPEEGSVFHLCPRASATLDFVDSSIMFFMFCVHWNIPPRRVMKGVNDLIYAQMGLIINLFVFVMKLY